mmetsp:Transcript_2348/g.5889  ORF Transcript_2348/g.5889 Transcript_2348/m.5889 type:complete len:347 (-) Transcript_2348:891-1931(-)
MPSPVCEPAARTPSCADWALERRLLLGHVAHNPLQDGLRLHAQVLHGLGHRRPALAMVRLGSDAPVQHLLLRLRAAELQLKLVVLRPEVAHVGLQGHGAVEPAARLVHLAVVPEQVGHGRHDVGVVVAAFERIHRLGAPLRAGRHRDRLRPQPAAAGAVLQRLGQQRLCRLGVAAALLRADGGQPELLVLGVLQARLLQGRARLAKVAGGLLQRRGRRPQRDGVDAVPAALGVRRARGGRVAAALLQLAQHHPQLPRRRELLQPVHQQAALALRAPQGALHDGALHPHAFRGGGLLITRLLQDGARALWLVVLKLQLEGCEVDLLAAGVGGEGFLQDPPRCVDVAR